MNNSANSHFDAALSKPTVSERCRELSRLIDECSTKLLHNNFVSIIHHIFGINCTGWGILTANPRLQSTECRAMKEFLCCGGALFRLLYKLQNESMLFLYDFPCSMLPTNFVHSPGESPAAVWKTCSPLNNSSQFGTTLYNSSQLSSVPPVQPSIRVSAFEFYFYHFACCIVRSQSSYHPQVNYSNLHQLPPSVDENLYYLLIDDYLTHFIPVDGTCLQTLQIPSTKPGSSLLYPGVTSLLRKLERPSSTLGSVRNEMWRSDMVVHVFVEFWLGSCVTRRDQKNTVPPSEDLIRAIRRLVKHLHFFNNVTNVSLNQSHFNDTSLDVFKHNIMYNCLQPRLFHFLCFCFKVWPLNSSFRVVLETWLSFIQPWRYTDINNVQKTTEMRLSSDREIANMWYHFISNNLQFYTQLFYESINRFVRMDISKQANSLLLYRVAKIFSQPNLFEMIEEAKAAFYGEKQHQMTSAMSFFSTSRNEASINPSICLLSSEEMRRAVNQLLTVCNQALGTVKKYSSTRPVDFSSHFLSLIGLGALTDIGSDNLLNANWKKSQQQIEDSMQLLANLFDLSTSDSELNLHARDNIGNPFGPDAPDVSLSQEGKAILSEFGRYEIVNNIKKLPVYPNTKPELQPIRSFENAFLVRLLYKLSSAINEAYGDNLEQFCSRPTFWGKLAKNYLTVSYDLSPTFKVKDWQNRRAQVDLRILAHYRTLFYIVVYFLICKLLGVSFIRAILMAASFLVLFLILKAAVREYMPRTDT